jgi:hypothetical protein
MLASVGGELAQALSFALGMFWEILWGTEQTRDIAALGYECVSCA